MRRAVQFTFSSHYDEILKKNQLQNALIFLALSSDLSALARYIRSGED